MRRDASQRRLGRVLLTMSVVAVLAGCQWATVPDQDPELAPTPPTETASSRRVPKTTPPPSPSRSRNDLPYFGESVAAWRAYWRKGGWHCQRRPANDDTSTNYTCLRRRGHHAEMVELGARVEDDVPMSLTILVVAPDSERDRAWRRLVSSLRPVLGQRTTNSILAEGGGGGFDYYDPVDVRTQAGYRVGFGYELLVAGVQVSEMKVTDLQHAVRKAGGRCDYYGCIGPDKAFTVAYGVAPDTISLLAKGHATDSLIWKHLGQTGRAVLDKLADGPDYQIAVVNNYLGIRSREGRTPVIFVTATGGMLRGDLPSGKKPRPPRKPS